MAPHDFQLEQAELSSCTPRAHLHTNMQARNTGLTTALCKTQAVFPGGDFQLCQLCTRQGHQAHHREQLFKELVLRLQWRIFQQLCPHRAPSGCSFGTRAAGECQPRAQPRASPARPQPSWPLPSHGLPSSGTPPLSAHSLRPPCPPGVPSSPPAVAATPQLCSALLPHPALGPATHISQACSSIPWHISDHCLILSNVKWDINCQQWKH